MEKKESFSELFQKSLETSPVQLGELVKGTVVNIGDKYVTVDIGSKSEGVIPLEEFMGPRNLLEVKVGDEVDVILETLADAFGETRLSREKAKRAKAWEHLVKAEQTKEIVKGFIVGKVKGGFTVDVDGIKGFLPGSLVSVHAVPADIAEIEGKELEFKVIKVDDLHGNVVVSHRAVIEDESLAERSKLLEMLKEGQILKGIVKNITDYGAFIDLGGIDGLLHITDISWKRIRSPSEVLKIGDEVTVVVLKFDKENNRLSLGMKQLSVDPWINIKERYPIGAKVPGRVTNLTDYGCFVEIEEGIEGLVHMSEMDWTNKNISPRKLVQVGDQVDVVILDIDEDRRRISLSIKQGTTNPWVKFAESHNEGDVIKGTIKSITDFGIFIGLENNIDGLVHLSDISWTEAGEQAIRQYKKGEEIEAIILAIDPERERISLGIKQLQNNPFGNYVTQHSKGEIVKAKVTKVEPKLAWFELAEEVPGRMKASEFSEEKIDDLTQVLQVDEEIEAKIVGINHKEQFVNLSIRAKEEGDAERSSKKGKETSAPGAKKPSRSTLGDLLKEQLENQEEKD